MRTRLLKGPGFLGLLGLLALMWTQINLNKVGYSFLSRVILCINSWISNKWLHNNWSRQKWKENERKLNAKFYLVCSKEVWGNRVCESKRLRQASSRGLWMDPLFSLNLLHQFLLLERVHIQEYILEQVLVEMTNGGVDRSIECTGNVQAMISAFESVHDVCILFFLVARIYSNLISSIPFSMFNDPKIFVAGLGCGCSCGGA